MASTSGQRTQSKGDDEQQGEDESGTVRQNSNSRLMAQRSQRLQAQVCGGGESQGTPAPSAPAKVAEIGDQHGIERAAGAIPAKPQNHSATSVQKVAGCQGGRMRAKIAGEPR